MNKRRRKELARAADLLRQALEIVGSVRDEEQEAYDNLPEGLQSAPRGEAIQEAAENLDTTHAELESTIDTLAEIIGE